MKNMLVKYIRSNRGWVKDKDGNVIRRPKPIGVLVAYTDLSSPKRYLIGYSLCHKRDQFTKMKGLEIAKARAIAWAMRSKSDDVPRTLWDELLLFLGRCDRFFKGYERPSWLDPGAA
jgi:hypothetical protein